VPITIFVFICTFFEYNRAHGETQVENEYEMSKQNLVEDIALILITKYGSDNPPPYLLVGHSLGGALTVHCCHYVKKNDSNQDVMILPSIVGICVIDVVEGTALNSLIFMHSIINQRPKTFDTIENAIQYCVSGGMIHNAKSAVLSVPSMFMLNEKTQKYEWRTQVLKTEPYWKDWFTGLSELFLKAPVARLLLLAG